MNVSAAFVFGLLTTLAFLGGAFATGLRAQRKRHIACVLATLASLGVTIYFALQVGRLYDLPSAGIITPIHLWLARITTFSYLLPIGTGIRTIYVPSTRSLHRKLAFTALAMTIATAITGTLMLVLATPVSQV